MFEEKFMERHKGHNRKERGTDRPIPCTIITAPEAETEEVYVHVRKFGENARRGPCKWTPRPGVAGPVFPEGGEEAIMQFDLDGIPWITQWWPS